MDKKEPMTAKNDMAASKEPRMKWQSLADAGSHPKPNVDDDVGETTGKRQYSSNISEERFVLLSRMLEKTPEDKHPFRRTTVNDLVSKKMNSEEIRAQWDDFLDGVEPSPESTGTFRRDGNNDEEQRRTQHNTEEMQILRDMTIDEVNEMAERFVQLHMSDDDEEENHDNSGFLPVASIVSARDVTVVHVGEDDENGLENSIVTGYLVSSFYGRGMKEPIYASVPWLTPKCLMIAGSFLLVTMTVSLVVSLTNMGGTSYEPKSEEPSVSPSLQPSTIPSLFPTQLPTLSALPTSSFILWNQTGIDVNGQADEEYMGDSIALSSNGNELWAGGNGVLRIFALSGDDWSLRQDLSSEVRSWIRVSVSLDGSAFVVGEAERNSKRGRATIYRRLSGDGMRWEPCGDPLDGEEGEDQFGSAVDINGNGTVVIVGAFNGNYVHVHRCDEETKTGNQTLVTRIQGEASSKFGVSVAMSADSSLLVVGAQFARIDDRNKVGAVYVYSLSLFPVRFSFLQRLGGDEAFDNFGWSVDVSSEGGVIAVGTHKGDYVRVYATDGSSPRSYAQLGEQLRGSPGSRYGRTLSVSADGTRLAVGARLDGEESGRAFVYAVRPRRHQNIGEFGDAVPGDRFGFAVALSANGTRVAVSSYAGDGGGENSGYVRVFESTDEDNDDDGV